MKHLIKIDRASVRENPNAGNTTYYVAGMPIKEYDEEGRVVSVKQDVQYLHRLTPESKFFYEYVPTEVKCEECGAQFLYTELKESEEWDVFLENVCPKCGTADCCELEFEKL